MYHVPDPIHEPLYVITPIFNPARYKSRWKHYQRFAEYVRNSGAVLYTIEASFGERQHAIETLHTGYTHDRFPALRTGDDPKLSHTYIRVQTDSELWIKENLINLAVQRLPADWKYVAWIDADTMFARPNWVGEAIHQLQHFKFLQLFSQAYDLGPNYEMSKTPRTSFVDSRLAGAPLDNTGYSGGRGATGLAWAARRDAWDAVGGLMDFCVLGSADWHMAHALFGLGKTSVPGGLTDDYSARIQQWEDRATRYIRQNVGVMQGLVLHYWHGKKSDRQYKERWRALRENQFAPSTDLKPDWQGVHQLCDHGDDRSRRLRDGVRDYFRLRNEDSIDE